MLIVSFEDKSWGSLLMGWNQFSPRRRLIPTSRRPLLAKEPGYMLSTTAPVFIDRLQPVGGNSLRPGGWPEFEQYQRR